VTLAAPAAVDTSVDFDVHLLAVHTPRRTLQRLGKSTDHSRWATQSVITSTTVAGGSSREEDEEKTGDCLVLVLQPTSTIAGCKEPGGGDILPDAAASLAALWMSRAVGVAAGIAVRPPPAARAQ